MTKKANKVETAIAGDEAEVRSLSTGEVLKEKGLCPLVIVRCTAAGNFIGYLARFNEVTRTAELLEARNLWRWRGANTLREVSLHGVETDEYTRISEAVPQSCVFGVDELLPISEKAAPSLTQAVWNA